MTELFVPREPMPGEAVELQIATRLPPGARLLVLDQNGNLLGAVTPFGPGQEIQTATVPIERSLLNGKSLKIGLLVSKPGVPQRSPRREEISRLNLVLAPGSND